MDSFIVKGKVEKFEVAGAWYYVKVPKKLIDKIVVLPTKGFIPIKVKLGKTIWDTSLLPMGDGTHFIALKSEVRKKERISLGDEVRLEFFLRF